MEFFVKPRASYKYMDTWMLIRLVMFQIEDQPVVSCFLLEVIATLLWPSVGVKPNTPKVGDLESFRTPECLELDRKAQNTLHRGVLGVIKKVLKLRYRKWPCIGHLDISSQSYGQKKGRESNWQFDSRPLKVRNRPLPDL